jgi:hypothetical protein
VESKAALGRACNVSRPVIAASITTSEHKELSSKIAELKMRLTNCSFDSNLVSVLCWNLNQLLKNLVSC